MNRKKLWAGWSLVAAAMIALGGSRARADVVIDFDDLAHAEIVTTQYESLGVIFGGAQALKVPDYNFVAYPPFSGDTVVYDYFDGTITATATAGTTWTSVGGYITGNTAIFVDAYDINGNLLGTATTGEANFVGSGSALPPNVFIGVSAPGIAYAIFHDTGNSFTLDNFTFAPTGVVPEPASMAMLAVGGLTLVGRAWRKRRA